MVDPYPIKMVGTAQGRLCPPYGLAGIGIRLRTPFVRGPIRLSSTAAAAYVTQKPTLLINQGFFGH
jgi:hypothetical protein